MIATVAMAHTLAALFVVTCVIAVETMAYLVLRREQR